MGLASFSSDLIFIITNQIENQQALKKILENEGYLIKILRKDERDIKFIKTSQPIAIILDFLPYEFEGFEIIHCLKNDKQTYDIPILFIGSTSSVKDKAKAFEAGANDYVTKPYYGVEITSRIKNLIELYKSRNHLNEIIKSRTSLLKRINEKYEKLINNISDIVYSYHFAPENKFDFISSAAYKATGYRETKFYSSDFFLNEVIHPEDKVLFVNHCSNPKELKGPLTLRWLRKDCKVIWMEHNHTPIYDDNSGIVGIEGVARDVTERKRTEEKLIQSESKLIDTQKMAQLGYWEWDIKTGAVKWSKEVYKIFWLEPDRFVPQIDSILALSPWPEDHERDKELIQKAIESKEIGSYEQRFLRPDGSIGYYQSTFQGSYNENDELISMYGTVQDITKRKIAENALRESEIKYRRLVESLKHEYFFYTHDTKGVFTYVSPSIKNILGYTAEEFLTHFSEYMTDSLINAKVESYTAQSIKGIEQAPYELEILHKNGEVRILEVKEVPIFDGDNKVFFVEGIAHDVSEQRIAQEKIRESEEQYRILFENMNEGFALHEMIFDDKGEPYDYRYLAINPMFTKLTGLKSEIAIGKTIRELIPETPNDPANWINKAGSVVLTGKDLIMEDFSAAIKKWFRVHLFKAKENQFAVTFSDISESKLSEEKVSKLNESLEKRVIERTSELENTNKLLKTERDIAQKYLDLVDVIILTLDLNNNVTMINKKGCEVFGYRECDIIGKNWYQDLRDKEGGEKGLKEFSRLVNRKSVKVTYNENKIITKSGQKRLIAWRDINIQDFNGNPAGMLSAGEDITERRALEDRLVKAKIEANQANQAKSEFLANMSHEIRTPMNAILGFSDLLANLINGELQQSYLDSIKSSGRSLLSLINDILDFSKIEAGKMELEYKHVNLYAVFQEMSAIFALKVVEKQLEFIMDIDPSVPSIVYFDEIRLRQVLINLLNNAIKFTERGYVRMDAYISNKKRKGEKECCDLIIEIEDTGIGIPKKAQGRIFDSFTQQEGQNIKKYGGTGLGLTISKTLINLMNGTITLKSEIGKGSIFTIKFHDIKVAKDIPEFENSFSIDPKSVEFNGSKVLIVDDIDDNRNYIEYALRRYNLQLEQADNGTEALRKATLNTPDLIITDLWMPVMDGLELKKQLSLDPKLSKIPVIAISASVMKETMIKVKEHRFSSFISKPFRISELLNEIVKFLPYVSVNKNVKEDIKEEKISKIKVDNVKAFLNEIVRLDKIHKPLINRQPIKDVKSFANNCVKVAKAFDIAILKEYGELLLEATNNFDIDALLKHINSYQKLIDAIKEHVID